MCQKSLAQIAILKGLAVNNGHSSLLHFVQPSVEDGACFLLRRGLSRLTALYASLVVVLDVPLLDSLFDTVSRFILWLVDSSVPVFSALVHVLFLFGISGFGALLTVFTHIRATVGAGGDFPRLDTMSTFWGK